MPAIPRSLAAAAAATVLAAVLAACQEPAPTPEPDTGPSTAAEPSDSGTSSDTLFLGESAHRSRPTVHVPTAPVGKPVNRHLDVTNPKSEAQTVQRVSAAETVRRASVGFRQGEMYLAEDNCTGVELPPHGSCTVVIQHVAFEPGGYSGQLTVETSDGEIYTVDVIGEATAGESTGGTEEPSDPSPTGDGAPTDVTPTEDPSPTEDAAPTEATPTEDPPNGVMG
ncbi:hypothetical protein [Streptomyces sp. 2P-4]|uniref:hypothetical protein n=1 Tax=Streptomyces sp. 2P-4 TaxID=2931974 RepID=UPI002541C49F|nr:hypothetical protein [Streptomyces sp. 2P-4]